MSVNTAYACGPQGHLWEIPVVQRDMGLNAGCQQAGDEADVEVYALLIQGPIAFRINARPCNGHPESLDPQGLHDLDVAHVAVVEVICHSS